MKIIRATECNDPKAMIDAGFAIYKGVLDDLPRPFPVIILPRQRADFKPEETLLAVNDNGTEVLGIALLEEIHDVPANVGRFGQKAVSLTEAFLKVSGKGPVYELGGIAVSPAARKQGLGAAFYQAAARLSDNRCVAVITAANAPSQKAADKAGFNRIPYAVFNAPFSVVDGYATPDPNGAHRVIAHLYAPGFKPVISRH